MHAEKSHDGELKQRFNQEDYVVMGMIKVASNDGSRWEALVYGKSRQEFLHVSETSPGKGLSERIVADGEALKWLSDKGYDTSDVRIARYLSQGPKGPGASKPEARMKVMQARRDHAVVTDLSSEKGYKVMSLVELKKHPHKSRPFIGTKSECQKWLEAPDAEARFEVELWAVLRNKTRVPLPSEIRKTIAIETSVQNLVEKFGYGQQTSLFDGRGLNMPAEGKGIHL